MGFKQKLIVFLFYQLLFLSVINAQTVYSDISSNQHTNILDESFESNTNKWITDNSWIKGEFANSKYHLICKNFNQNTGLSYITISLDRQKDFEIETSFSLKKGTGAVVFGMTKNFDHYRFEINKKAVFSIIKDSPSKNKVEKLFSGSAESFAEPYLSNKFTIRKLKETYYFYINELMICQLKNINLSGNQFGYSVGLNSSISVDYLNVSYLQEIETPLLAEIDSVYKDTISAPPQINEVILDQVNNVVKTTPKSLDPLITWTSPSTLKTPYDLYSARVKASVISDSELQSVIFFVNGSPKGEAERSLIQGEQNKYIIEKVINLSPGENVVYFLATNQNGSKRSEDRYFINPEATKPVITWGNPVKSKVIVNNDMITIEACINSPAGLKSVKVMVNGESQGEDNLFQITTGSYCNVKWQRPVILKEDVDNSIYIIANNDAGFTTSENRIIRYSKTIVENRIALVIGNSNYDSKAPLINPMQDANLMEGTLKKLGFTVLKYTDLDLSKMRSAIRDFSQKMKDYNVALFYYAGHGVQVEGQNYLIPVDAKLDSKDDCKWETFAINDLMEEFENNQNNINIAILDACRSNPFKSWVRGDEAGFIPLTNTSGTFVSFSTAPGSTANDGNSGNGLFTEELVKQLNIPQPISSVFLNTRINVWERSKHTQRPQEWNDLNGDFYFKK
jgi:Caspase domain